jgi:hypothetical protein
VTTARTLFAAACAVAFATALLWAALVAIFGSVAYAVWKITLPRGARESAWGAE